jgi:hypothetical protein
LEPKTKFFIGLLLFSKYVTQRKLSAWLLVRSPSIWSTHGLLSGFGMKAAATNLCNRNVLRIPLHKATVLYLFPEPHIFKTNCFLIDLNAVELSVVTLASAFYGCSRLEQITGILKIASNVPLTDAFKGCAVLHTVKLSGLSSNIDLSDCAQLSVETIEHLIENSIQPGSGTITITVHPDVNNNINNNSSWGNVRALLQEKTYITIQSATA